MDLKYIEIRDRGTFIPALALRFTGSVNRLVLRAGFGRDMPYVVLMNLVKMEAQYDPYAWTYARTMQVAHQWLIEHWYEQEDGGVLDVEYVLGESTTPKQSEYSSGAIV